MELHPDSVRHIHHRGGTILGTSRGPQNEEMMAKFLIEKKIDILFTIGGDGTLRGDSFSHMWELKSELDVGAMKICEALEQINAKISVIGIPKTIDNDISFTDKVSKETSRSLLLLIVNLFPRHLVSIPLLILQRKQFLVLTMKR